MGACLSVEEQAALAQDWTPLHKACFAGKASHVSVSGAAAYCRDAMLDDLQCCMLPGTVSSDSWPNR